MPVSELFTFGKAFAFTISCFALFCPSFATGFPLTEFYPSPPLQAMWQQVFVFTTRSFCICVSVYLCIGVSRVYLCIKSVFVYCVLCWSGTKATVALVQVAPKPPVAPTCLHKTHCVNSESYWDRMGPSMGNVCSFLALFSGQCPLWTLILCTRLFPVYQLLHWSFTEYHWDCVIFQIRWSIEVFREQRFLATKPTRLRTADFRFGRRLKPVVRTGLSNVHGTTTVRQHWCKPLCQILISDLTWFPKRRSRIKHLTITKLASSNRGERGGEGWGWGVLSTMCSFSPPPSLPGVSARPLKSWTTLTTSQWTELTLL